MLQDRVTNRGSGVAVNMLHQRQHTPRSIHRYCSSLHVFIAAAVSTPTSGIAQASLGDEMTDLGKEKIQTARRGSLIVLAHCIQQIYGDIVMDSSVL